MTAHELLTAHAVRQASSRMMQDGISRRLQCWTVDRDALPAVADLVATVTRRNYPDLVIPFHSRWRHFLVGGRDRWARLQAGWSGQSAREKARRAFDLVIPSVLADAGAGPHWVYSDPETGKSFTSSEGLALASIELYRKGVASGQSGALEADWLKNLSEKQFCDVFQVSGSNPLAGVGGRVALLRALGRVCAARPELFAAAGTLRPGGLVDRIFAASKIGRIGAPEILMLVLDALGPIWPSRLSLDGQSLGDSWIYPPWQKSAEPDAGCIVPFHKLSQWMTFSLIEPLEDAGLIVNDIDGLTGLAEYRNGGLFVDGEVLKPANPSLLREAHAPGSIPVVEWRALTVALLDMLRPMVAERLGLSPHAFPLPRLLEGGTWAVGRQLAQLRRGDRSPPIKIVSDGTVF